MPTSDQAPRLRVSPEAVQTDRIDRTAQPDGSVLCTRIVWFFDLRGEKDSYDESWTERPA